MVDWDKVKLGELGNVITGKTPPTEDKTNYGTDYMFIGPTDLHKHFIIQDSVKMISSKGLETIKGSILDGTSILVGCIGWDMGNVGIVFEKCATNQQINSITNIKEIYNPLYIYYWLKNKKSFLFSIAGVTRTPVLNKTNFSNIVMNIPQKNYQDKIASILSFLDKKIELNNKINQKLEAMAKILYDYWFVQFDFPDENGKPYKSSGGKMVYSEELKREIPEGWEVEIVGNILSSVSRTKKISSKEVLVKGDIPIIDQSTSFICGFTTEIDSIIYTDNSPKIVFGDHTRILKFINFDFARGADGTQVLFSCHSRMPQHLFFYTLKNIDLSNYGYARHFKFLKDSKIIIPNKNISDKYDLIVRGFYEQIKNNIFENQKLTQQRDWLLPMLMNGQVGCDCHHTE